MIGTVALIVYPPDVCAVTDASNDKAFTVSFSGKVKIKDLSSVLFNILLAWLHTTLNDEIVSSVL